MMFSFFKKNTNPKAKLKRVLKGYQLPSFPAVVMQILQKIRNPDSSMSSIAESLALDPGLSIRVLGLASSAAFSPLKKVENLTQAISLVGLSQLESLVLSIGVSKGIPKTACQWHDPKEFWLTSAKRAMLAKSFARRLCPAKESECFTIAFLQDMALPFLACQRLKEYGPIFEKWHVQGGDLAVLEREVFDWDHAEVGTWICAEWGLPENIAAGIGGHHTGEIQHYEILGPVRLAAMLREGESNPGLDEMIKEAEAVYQISPEQMDEIVEDSFGKAEELARVII